MRRNEAGIMGNPADEINDITMNDNETDDNEIIIIDDNDIYLDGVFSDIIVYNAPAQEYAPRKIVRRGNEVYHNLVRNYLNRALGDRDMAEIKLKDMQAELGMTSNTLYRHLKSLRDTEFIIKKRRYYTELRRRDGA